MPGLHAADSVGWIKKRLTAIVGVRMRGRSGNKVVENGKSVRADSLAGSTLEGTRDRVNGEMPVGGDAIQNERIWAPLQPQDVVRFSLLQDAGEFGGKRRGMSTEVESCFLPAGNLVEVLPEELKANGESHLLRDA